MKAHLCHICGLNSANCTCGWDARARRAPDAAQLLQFAQMLARMTTPEESPASDDDNALTLGEIITTARQLTGYAPTNPTTTKEQKA